MGKSSPFLIIFTYFSKNFPSPLKNFGFNYPPPRINFLPNTFIVWSGIVFRYMSAQSLRLVLFPFIFEDSSKHLNVFRCSRLEECTDNSTMNFVRSNEKCARAIDVIPRGISVKSDKVQVRFFLPLILNKDIIIMQ